MKKNAQILFLDFVQVLLVAYLVQSHANGMLSFEPLQMLAQLGFTAALIAAAVIVFRDKVPWRPRMSILSGFVVFAVIALVIQGFVSEGAWIPLLLVWLTAGSSHVMAALQ